MLLKFISLLSIIFISLFFILSCSEKQGTPEVIVQKDTVYVEKENLKSNEPVKAELSQKQSKELSARPEINKPPTNKEKNKTINPYANANFSIEIINGIAGTFGYVIKMEGRNMIQQPNIPGMPGNQGFKTKEQSEKVAKFVITKIKKNIMPPSVTIEELDSLGVLK